MRKLISLLLIIALAALPLFPSNTFAQNEAPSTEFAPAADIEPEAAAEGQITQKLTMDLKGVDILDVLKIISKTTGLNIVAGKNVQGNVTLFLQDVDVWSALKKVLETTDMAFIEEDGIIRVMTEKDYEGLFGKPFHDYRTAKSYALKNAKASEVSELLNQIKSNIGRVVVDERTNSVLVLDIPQVLEQVDGVIKDMDTPTESKVFSLRYAVAEDIEPKLKSVINPVTGSLEVDKRSNKVYVRDLPERIRQVQTILQEFDSQPYQVMIDAKVIQVELNDQTRFGINWTEVVERNKKAPYKFSAPLTVSAPSSGPLSGVTLTSITGDATASAVSGGDDNFNFVITALEGVGKTNTLSSPRLTVMNNQEAKLAVATREPFISQSVVQGDNTATTADNVQFVDVGVTMTVKPTITSDNHVMIKIKPAVSSSGTPVELEGVASGSNTTFVRSRIPVVTTQEVETTVIVKSGTTIVMGGLIQDSAAKTMHKIPVMGDIPVLGAAFRNKTEDFRKNELVIFLTPYIILPEKKTEETERFFVNEPKAELRDFDEVGDTDFVDAYRQSNHALKRRYKPFWLQELQAEVSKRNPYSSHPLTFDSPDTEYLASIENIPATTSSQAIEISVPLDEIAVADPAADTEAAEESGNEAEETTDRKETIELSIPAPVPAQETSLTELREKARQIKTLLAPKTGENGVQTAPAVKTPVPAAPAVKSTADTAAAPVNDLREQKRYYRPTPTITVSEKDLKPSPAPSSPAAEGTEPSSYSSFVPENQSVIIFQEIQKHDSASDPLRIKWKEFFESLKSDIIKTLRQNATLAQLHGDVRLEFIITRTGEMKSLLVQDTRHIRGPGQKMLIAEVLAKRASYTPLPRELGDEKKIHLTVRL